MRNFVIWCHTNNLQLNTLKTKELVIDFGRDRPRPRPVLLGAEEMEVMETYKYLGLWLDNKLGWTSNTKQLYKKAQSRMYFLKKLRSFNICRKLLRMFYQSVVASFLSYTSPGWRSWSGGPTLWQRGEPSTNCGASWTIPTTLCTPSSAARRASPVTGCSFQRARQTD